MTTEEMIEKLQRLNGAEYLDPIIAKLRAANKLAKAVSKLSLYTDHNLVNGDYAVTEKDAKRLGDALEAYEKGEEK